MDWCRNVTAEEEILRRERAGDGQEGKGGEATALLEQ